MKSLKPNFKEAAKKYRRLYIKFKGYFLFIRDEFARAQIDRNNYMLLYKDAVDENDRLKFKIAELQDKLHKQEAAYNELYEYCSAGKGATNEQRKAD